MRAKAMKDRWVKREREREEEKRRKGRNRVWITHLSSCEATQWGLLLLRISIKLISECVCKGAEEPTAASPLADTGFFPGGKESRQHLFQM
jgi:hypothetical protein